MKARLIKSRTVINGKVRNEIIRDYDDRGNLIHEEDTLGMIKDYTYDVFNRLIHFKNSRGFEYIQEYDGDNIIHYKEISNQQYEWWKHYDKFGNEIYFKDNNGREFVKRYDDNGRVTYYRSNKHEEWNTYDDKGRIIYSKKTSGNCKYLETWSIYDTNGKLIRRYNSDGYDMIKDYDEYGNCTHYYDTSGVEKWYEYEYDDSSDKE